MIKTKSKDWSLKCFLLHILLICTLNFFVNFFRQILIIIRELEADKYTYNQMELILFAFLIIHSALLIDDLLYCAS